jgi:hypothetical protein
MAKILSQNRGISTEIRNNSRIRIYSVTPTPSCLVTRCFTLLQSLKRVLCIWLQIKQEVPIRTDNTYFYIAHTSAPTNIVLLTSYLDNIYL